MGFPVVLKIVSPEILHKTEAGGVLVGVKNAADVEAGFATIMANAKKYDAKANLQGVQVQQMIMGGQEVIIGAVTDPSFGKLVAFGLGGILVEVLKDITFRLAPATKADALSMLDGIGAAAILKGVRGSDRGEPRRAGGADRERFAARVRLPADRGNGPQPGVRVEGGSDRRRRAHRARLHAAGGTLSPKPAGNRPADEQGDEAGRGGGDRRVRRDRQDRQLGDEEPDQRRLQGQDLPDQPVGRQDHGIAGLQERQGRPRRHRHRGVRDPRQVRAPAR